MKTTAKTFTQCRSKYVSAQSLPKMGISRSFASTRWAGRDPQQHYGPATSLPCRFCVDFIPLCQREPLQIATRAAALPRLSFPRQAGVDAVARVCEAAIVDHLSPSINSAMQARVVKLSDTSATGSCVPAANCRGFDQTPA
jgi:hypothetical protein